MIYSLKGRVQELTPTYAVLDVHGVGYYLAVSLQTSANIVTGAEVFLYTQQIFREDAQLLYGFYTSEEKQMFNLLISVNGVGPASALIMLSSLSNSDIAAAIANGQSGILQRVKGIGTKTAERIIVDLRDKISAFAAADENISTFADNKVLEEALSAVEVLGIPKKTSQKLAERLLKQDGSLTVEALVKQILKSL